MCRWLAYCGSPIYLESLIFKPENSLISQSRRALRSVSVTNGDGFGVGWYGERAEPGLYRDIQPAWNDDNLRSISAQIRSPMFFAHVRASTGTSVSRANCHPFGHENWLFMHNGRIGGFERIRRDLAMLVAPDLFGCIEGTTDSETLFYLLLTNGLREDPVGALVATIAQIRDVMAAAEIEAPFTLTGAVSDGRSIHAVRYADVGEPPSLYYGCGVRPHGAEPGEQDCSDGSILILSEPLDSDEQRWIAVPESHVLVAGDGGVAVLPLAPSGGNTGAADAVTAANG